MYENIVNCYISMIEFCVPFIVVFGVGNLAVSTILRAAFGGRVILK